MTTVDDAVESGARALLASMSRYEYPGEDREHEWAARQVLPAVRAMWPILSAGLRELVGWLNDDQDSVALEEVLGRIDKELGL